MSAAFTFTEQGHRYEEAGAVIPSVSQILTLSGIDDVSMIPVRNLVRARDIGTAVHQACELLDKDDLDLESIDPQILGYMVGYQKFREEYDFKTERIEHRMIGENEGLRYGMCLDRIGTIDQGTTPVRILLDIKTASKPSPSWAIQTAAYCVGYSAVDKYERPLRGVVHLSKDGTYRLINHTSDTDFHIWGCALRLAWWRLGNGAKLRLSSSEALCMALNTKKRHLG